MRASAHTVMSTIQPTGGAVSTTGDCCQDGGLVYLEKPGNISLIRYRCQDVKNKRLYKKREKHSMKKEDPKKASGGEDIGRFPRSKDSQWQEAHCN